MKKYQMQKKNNKKNNFNYISIGVIVSVLAIILIVFEPINLNLLGIEEKMEEPISEYHNDIVRYWSKEYSKIYNIPSGMLESLLYQESKFNKNDVNYNAHVVGDHGKSFGPGQIQLPTAKSVWADSDVIITDKKLKYDLQFNVETAAKLLRKLYNDYKPIYKNDEKKTWLAAFTCYNTGSGSFEKNNRRFNNYSFEVYNRYLEVEKLKID